MKKTLIIFALFIFSCSSCATIVNQTKQIEATYRVAQEVSSLLIENVSQYCVIVATECKEMGDKQCEKWVQCDAVRDAIVQQSKLLYRLLITAMAKDALRQPAAVDELLKEAIKQLGVLEKFATKLGLLGKIK